MNSSTLLPNEEKNENESQFHPLEIIRKFLQKFGLFAESTAIHTKEDEAYVAQYDAALASDSYQVPIDDELSETNEETQLDEGNSSPRDKGSYGNISKQLLLGKSVAIKEITITDKFTLADCEREKNMMVALNKLNSPYIVRFIAFRMEAPKYFIMMEDIAAGSLSTYIKTHDTPFEWRTRYRIMEQLIEGLGHIHSKNILHRDIKSENVLLANVEDPDQIVAKFCDFGAAKYLQDQAEPLTTIAYMAPELISVRKVLSTAKSDIYTLGILFWGLAAWNPKPYHGLSLGAILGMTQKGERLDIPPCPQKIAHMIKWCWQDPESRPSDSELLTEARTGLDNESDQLLKRFSA